MKKDHNCETPICDFFPRGFSIFAPCDLGPSRLHQHGEDGAHAVVVVSRRGISLLCSLGESMETQFMGLSTN